MTLCDELEAKLARQQKDGAGLMEAVVRELVAGWKVRGIYFEKVVSGTYRRRYLIQLII